VQATRLWCEFAFLLIAVLFAVFSRFAVLFAVLSKFAVLVIEFYFIL